MNANDTTHNVTITISKDDYNLYTAKANGVPVGSVNTWSNNTLGACYAIGIKQRKALAMPNSNTRTTQHTDLQLRQTPFFGLVICLCSSSGAMV